MECYGWRKSCWARDCSSDKFEDRPRFVIVTSRGMSIRLIRMRQITSRNERCSADNNQAVKANIVGMMFVSSRIAIHLILKKTRRQLHSIHLQPTFFNIPES